jgi:hypothetical protein
MSRETALQLVKEKRRIDLFQTYHQSILRSILIIGLVFLVIHSLSDSIFHALLVSIPLITLFFFERYWVRKIKAQGNIDFYAVINNSNAEDCKFPIAYTVQDLRSTESNRSSHVFLQGDRDWLWLIKRSWEELFLHDGHAPHKIWQDYTVEQAVVLESGQATTIKFTFHFELTASEFMIDFLEKAFGRGLESFRQSISNVLKSQVDRVLGTFGRFEDTQDLFDKVQDRFDVSFSEKEMKVRLARSGLPMNIGLTHRHFEFQVCDHRSHGSRHELWEQPNVTK